MIAFYFCRRAIGLAARDRAAQPDLQRAAADRVLRRLSGLYVLLDAPFVAVIQIIVYAGAIMVLFLFVVMLLNAPHEDTSSMSGSIRCCGPGRCGSAPSSRSSSSESCGGRWRGGDTGAFPGGAVSSVRAIGRSLFTDYAFPFEVTSVLILVAMVGAVVLAKRDNPRDRRDRGGV